MTKDTFFANFGYLADAPKGVKKLRELILQLAVQGKLVPQDPTDEPASVLLAKIKSEKENLLKEKKTRKTEPLPPVSFDEVPYELPKGWEWVRLDDISYLTSGTSVEKDQELNSGDYLYIKVGDMNLPGNETSITTSTRYVNKSKFIDRLLIPSGSIIFPKRGGAIATNKKRIVVKPILVDLNTMAITCIRESYLKYIYLWFLTIDLWLLNNGTSVPQINNKDIAPLLLPFPPLAEQHCIVAKVDQLMALCDELETRQQKKKQKLLNLNNAALDRLLTARIPDDFDNAWCLIRDNFDFLYTTPETITKLRQSILQLAVQGKLVPQDPKDEPASVLLEKIKTEKERLIKEEKIKKASPLQPISPDEIPYELPQGWLWVRLGMLGITQTGTTPSTSNPEFFGSDYPFIKPADISDKNVRYNINEGLSKKGIEKGRLIEAFSVLMVCIGGSISKVNYIDRDCSCNQQINTITPFKGIDYRALTYFMASPFFKEQVIENAPSTTLPILSKGKWEALPIPLPPEAEQRHIVTKVDQLMKLCDELEAKLIKSQTKNEMLVEAAVKAMTFDS